MSDLVSKNKPIVPTVIDFAERAAARVMKFAGLNGPKRYYPEAHYMRGPGPKWRARHGLPERRLVLVVTNRGLKQP